MTDCAYCSNQATSIDHVYPQKKGGKSKHNLVAACRRCNSSKRDHDFAKWYTKQPFYDFAKHQKVLIKLNSEA